MKTIAEVRVNLSEAQIFRSVLGDFPLGAPKQFPGNGREIVTGIAMQTRLGIKPISDHCVSSLVCNFYDLVDLSHGNFF